MSVRALVSGACLLAWMVAATNCGSRAPAEPDPPVGTLAGTWSGPVDESLGGPGRLRLVISQAGAALYGTFSLDFEDPAFNRAGQLNGVVSPPSVHLLAPFTTGCTPEQIASGFLTLSVLNVVWNHEGDTLTGTYSGFGCTGAIAGEFEVTLEHG